jgi:hypothetical protein
MPDTILRETLGRLQDPLSRFVFPSEIAASSVLAAVLAATGRRALPARRFIGWDAFKSELFSGEAAGKPATKAIRSIFARLLAAENASKPFLRSIVPIEAADASARWAPSIGAALPALRSIPEGPGEHLADWREIRRRYAGFLESSGLYEASWLGREAGTTPFHWVLFYPDLTEDWDDYEPAIRGMDGTTIIDSAGLDSSPVPAARFGTIVEEARAILLRIRDEFADGTDPADIAISVAAPESSLPILEREAAMAGVPLDTREGRPLSESAGGRLVADLVALSRSHMSFEALRRLLFDRSRPWNDGETARRLIDTGVRTHIVAPLTGSPDVWEASIGADAEVRRLYRGLRTSASRIADATGFRSLKSAFEAFKMAFIDGTRWSPGQNDEIARCIAILDELDDAAVTARIEPNAIPGAADTFLEALQGTRYVPVSGSGGISVYRFPVAAGARPTLHFVMNLAEGDAKAASRPLSFMRADERERAGAVDRDISPGLIRLLSVSGVRVHLSYAENGPDGIRPPHPAIDAKDPGDYGLSYEREKWLPNLEAERQRPESPAAPMDAPPEVFPAQVTGARAALATVFGPDGPDWTRGTPGSPATMSPEKIQKVRSTLEREGTLELSDTAMEAYASCPFRRIYGGHLKVQAVESGLSFIDARLIGEVYHDAFRRLLRPLAEASLAVLAGDDDAAGCKARPEVSAMRIAIREAIGATGTRLGPMAGVLVATATPVLERNFTAAASALMRVIDGLRPVMVDAAELRAPLESVEANLRGRPDLVCVASGDDGRGGTARAMIVDYKKSRLPAIAELAPDDGGNIAAIQIPVYTALVKAAGYEPESAWYVSMEGSGSNGKRLLLVYGPGDKPAIPADKLSLIGPAVEMAARAAVRTIDAGLVFIPVKSDRDEACNNCDLRPVCRAHYTVR